MGHKLGPKCVCVCVCVWKEKKRLGVTFEIHWVLPSLTHTYAHTQVHAYAHIYTHAYAYVRAHTHTHTNLAASPFLSKRGWPARLHTHIHTHHTPHTYTHTCMHTHNTQHSCTHTVMSDAVSVTLVSDPPSPIGRTRVNVHINCTANLSAIVDTPASVQIQLLDPVGRVLPIYCNF